MQFDYGCDNIPLMEEIAKRFAEHGYKLPKNDNGVILISGFSKNLVEMVVSSDIDPYKALVKILNSDRYSVIDELDLT